MKQTLIILALVLFLAPCFVLAEQPQADRAEAFIWASKRLPVAERLDRARETIQGGTDEAVMAAAAREAIAYDAYEAQRAAREARCVHSWHMASHEERICRRCGAAEFLPDWD